MEEYEYDLNKFLGVLNQIYPGGRSRYNTDPIVVDLDELFNERSHIGVSDMGDLANYLAELRCKEKKVKESKDYTNGIPKAWDDEDII
jgi:hypothetical protein